MQNYKAMMAHIDKMIQQKDKSLPVSTSGLLAPKGIKTEKQDDTSVEAQLAKYIALIRKQREELIK
jgi:hypothetical protein